MRLRYYQGNFYWTVTGAAVYYFSRVHGHDPAVDEEVTAWYMKEDWCHWWRYVVKYLAPAPLLTLPLALRSVLDWLHMVQLQDGFFSLSVQSVSIVFFPR